MLEVRNLTKVYADGTMALKNVSFTVPDGEFLVVIGLSGSGKSTLLRCINRLIDPTDGQILWNGVDLPPESDGEDSNNWRFLKSRSGHIVRLDDTAGQEKIEIIDQSEEVAEIIMNEPLRFSNQEIKEIEQCLENGIGNWATRK